jgi:hypothetical protein
MALEGTERQEKGRKELARNKKKKKVEGIGGLCYTTCINAKEEE